ncbi:M12 family metallopeptidase [Kitasatospora sp. NPDC058965]|uniref:M12 family metallopeptidase n=1 Tax=Kitasatospora sp. NPDC058965 TaxID=3346682 RepID=UPI00369F7488
MTVHRYIAHGAAPALLLGLLAGPLSPAAEAAEPEHYGSVALDSLAYLTPDRVRGQVSYSCVDDSATALTVGFEQQLADGSEAAGSATTDQVTCDGRTHTATLDLAASEGGAHFTDPATGWASVTLAGDEEPVAEEGFDVGAQGRSLGRANTRYRWDRAVIPYEIDAALPTDKQNEVQAAIAHWNSNTPVVFVARTAENASFYPDYVYFQPSASSCNSYVGRIGGKQAVNIPTWCKTGSIIHEVGHAVGLWHEQSRPDRDSYVKIDLAPVQESSRHNFAKHTGESTFNTAYDFDSIMHYGPKAFSSTGAETIIPLKPLAKGAVMGQRNGLSKGDIEAVAAMYKQAVGRLAH